MTYTTTDAARLLGVARRTVIKHAARLGLPMHGNAYLIDDQGIDHLRASIESARTGRPPHGEYSKRHHYPDDYPGGVR